MALQILLWLAVALVVLVGLLVCLPVYVAIRWQSDPVRRSTVLLRPFGGVSPPIKVFDSTLKPKRKDEHSGQKESGKVRAGRAPRGNVLVEVMTLLRRVLDAIHLERLHLDAEFGLGDPAQTGQLFGQLCPVIYGTGADVRIRPNFDHTCFDGDALARFRVTPIAVVWPIVGFGWRVFGPSR